MYFSLDLTHREKKQKKFSGEKKKMFSLNLTHEDSLSSTHDTWFWHFLVPNVTDTLQLVIKKMLRPATRPFYIKVHPQPLMTSTPAE